MVVRRVALLAVCLVMPVIMAPASGADPDPAPAPAGAVSPDDGRVPSADPVTLNTPDGWTLALGAKDEILLPVAPLTTATSSREYLASGTFIGSLKGPEQPRGVLEAGYEIGCGIYMSTSNGVTLGGNAGITPSLGFTGPLLGMPTGILPLILTPFGGGVSAEATAGRVIVVPVIKQQFTGPIPWVMISNFHVKIDGCVGQSFIRSYATLTRETNHSGVMLSYVGVTKAV